MIIAAALSIQDPRERPAEQRPQADQSHARFADPTSDFLTYLNLWQYVRDSAARAVGVRVPPAVPRRAPQLPADARVAGRRHAAAGDGQAARHPVEPPRPVSTRPDAHGRPTAGPADRTSSADDGTAPAPDGPGAAQDALASDAGDATTSLRLDWDADRIHVAMLSGLLSQIGMQEVDRGPGRPRRAAKPPPAKAAQRRGRNEYLGARGARFAIFPGSPPGPEAARLDHGRRARRDLPAVGAATPPASSRSGPRSSAAHLVKRTYSEPTWSTKQGAAMALERVLLYGVPIVAQRRVLYAKVDPEHARELFIRHALVEGEWTTHHAFFHDNRRLLAQAESLEHRARRRDLVVDDDALFAFYDERVPADVVSARHFDTWWKSARREDPDLLTFTLSMLVADDARRQRGGRSRRVWPQGDLELPLTYQFQPGTDADGVTVHIPLVVLNRVRPEGFDWMVPGLREELVVATIRSLPKPVRVQLVPAPDVARDIVAWIDDAHGRAGTTPCAPPTSRRRSTTPSPRPCARCATSRSRPTPGTTSDCRRTCG